MSENGAAGKVLLVSATAWPACAKLAIAFLGYGCEVEAVCASGHPLSYVSGIRKIYPYRACTSQHSLEAALRASMPRLIVPCDDGVVRQLHAGQAARVPGLHRVGARGAGLHDDAAGGERDAAAGIPRSASTPRHRGTPDAIRDAVPGQS